MLHNTKESCCKTISLFGHHKLDSSETCLITSFMCLKKNFHNFIKVILKYKPDLFYLAIFFTCFAELCWGLKKLTLLLSTEIVYVTPFH